MKTLGRLMVAAILFGGCATIHDAENVLTYRTDDEAQNECNRRGASWARSTWSVWLETSSAKRTMPWESIEHACFDYKSRATIRREGSPSHVVEHENKHARDGHWHE